MLTLVDSSEGCSRAIDVAFKNGKKGKAAIIPSVKNQSDFMTCARKYKWIEEIIKHAAPTTEEAAEWILYYFGKKNETSFLVSARTCGFPLIQRMDAVAAVAMTADANLTRTQQRIIAKHLRASFGSRVIIPESRQYLLGNTQKHPNASYGCYQFHPDPKKEPESCHFWYLDATEVLLSEVNLYVESLQGEYSELSPYTNVNGILGWTILGGGDHGKGAWRSHLKMYIRSPMELRDKKAIDKNDHKNQPYVIRQVAHVVCKKDDPVVMKNTVSDALDSAYSKIFSSQLVAMVNLDGTHCVSCLLPRTGVNIQQEPTGIRYTDAQGNDRSIFIDGMTANYRIILNVPSFSFYVVGDLSFYSDMQGKHKTSSNWCNWCKLPHKEWQKRDYTMKGELWKKDEFTEHSNFIFNGNLSLEPCRRLGITGEVQYKSVSPEHYVPPHLHITMGMINEPMNWLGSFIDEVIEPIEEDEKQARDDYDDAYMRVYAAQLELKELESTVGVEIKESQLEVRVLKRLAREASEEQRNDIDLQAATLEYSIVSGKSTMENSKTELQLSRIALKEKKELVQELRKARGRPPESAFASFEKVLKKYGASREAYHGGDFNGVSCRCIAQSAKAIFQELKVVLIEKKREGAPEEYIIETLGNIAELVGIIDAAMAALMVIFPTQEEREKARFLCTKAMMLWRALGFSVTLKAHIIDHHICDFNDEHGIGDKDENFIEQRHQECSRNEDRTKRVANFQQQHECIATRNHIMQNRIVQDKLLEVQQTAKRKFTGEQVEGKRLSVASKQMAVSKGKKDTRDSHLN